MPIAGVAGTAVQQAALKFSQCRDNRGTNWTTAVTVAATCDLFSAGGAWLGNRMGALYTVTSATTAQVYWKWTPNPDDWTINGPSTVSGVTGRVYGLACNQVGNLCAMVGKTPVISHDGGLTWTKKSALTLPSQYTITAFLHYFVIVAPGGTRVTHYVSRDGGETFL